MLGKLSGNAVDNVFTMFKLLDQKLRDLPALYDMEFVIVGRLTRDKDTIKGQITKLGGKLVSSIKPTTMAVISTEKEIEKMGSKIKQAETSQIHVVPEEFVDQAESNVGKIPELITKLSICSWGTDVRHLF